MLGKRGRSDRKASSSGDQTQLRRSETRDVERPKKVDGEHLSSIKSPPKVNICKTSSVHSEDNLHAKSGRSVNQPDRLAQAHASKQKHNLNMADLGESDSSYEFEESLEDDSIGDGSTDEESTLPGPQKRAKVCLTDAEKDSKIKEQEEWIKDLQRERTKFRKMSRARFYKIKDKIQRIKLVEDRKRRLYAAYKNLQSIESKANAEINRLQSALAESQEFNIDAVVRKVLPDDKVQDAFKNLRSSWNEWARHYARRSLRDVDESLLMHCVALGHGNDGARSSISTRRCLQATKFGPRILLTAAIAHSICGQIFRPFLYFEEFAESSIPNGTQGSLEWLNDQGMKYDQRQANFWRVQTSQMLHSLSSHLVSRSRTGNGKYKAAAYNNFCSRLMHQFSGLMHIETDSEEKCRNELKAICREAGRLASRLAYSKARLEVVGTFPRSEKFCLKSPEMEAHSTMLLDDDDTRLDGREVDFVVSPLIRAWGNESGENYDKFKVWSKAVVWIDEETIVVADAEKSIKPLPGRKANLDGAKNRFPMVDLDAEPDPKAEDLQSHSKQRLEAKAQRASNVRAESYQDPVSACRNSNDIHDQCAPDHIHRDNEVPVPIDSRVDNAAPTANPAISQHSSEMTGGAASEAASSPANGSENCECTELGSHATLETERGQSQCSFRPGNIQGDLKTQSLHLDHSLERKPEGTTTPGQEISPQKSDNERVLDPAAHLTDNAEADAENHTTSATQHQSYVEQLERAVAETLSPPTRDLEPSQERIPKT